MKKPFGLLIAAIFIWLFILIFPIELKLIPNENAMLALIWGVVIVPLLYIFLTLLLSVIYREWFVKYWFTILLLLILFLTISAITLIRPKL